MKRFSGFICILFVFFMFTSPLLIAVEANFISAQTSPTFSGELLLNPYFTQEPYVEIGSFSPEFDYEYSYADGQGSVSLIWTHTAGYQLDYRIFPMHCREYARVSEELSFNYNETPQAAKISASVEIVCTGDFATEDILGNAWEVNFQIYRADSLEPHTIMTISDLKDGDSEEIEFITSQAETRAFFDGEGVPQNITLFLQLVPTFMFGETIGDITPWEDYSGSVSVTIDHMSVEVMLEDESSVPPIQAPKYNTTYPAGESSQIMGIESAGYDTIHQYRYDYLPDSGITCSLWTLASNHQILRNNTILQNSQSDVYWGLLSFATSNDRIAWLYLFGNSTMSSVYIQCVDLQGDFLWNSTTSLYHRDISFLADFDSSGNLLVYVFSQMYPTDTYDPYNQQIRYSILKIDNQGNRIWNKTLLTISFSEYIAAAMGGNIPVPNGFQCVANDLFIGFDGKVLKYDSNGNQVWSREHSHRALCVDQQGGVYTFSRKPSFLTELTKWDTNGNIVWAISLGWNHGSGWIEYPYLNGMAVGFSGYLHLVLSYDRIHPCTVLTRVAPTGLLLSQDTIFEIDSIDESLPYFSDMSITGDGLVHLLQYPKISLLTYELPNTIINPISIAVVGIASVLIIGIAYDYFFRRGKIPESPVEPSISEFER